MLSRNAAAHSDNETERGENKRKTRRARRRGSEGDQDKARGTGRLRRDGAERAAREREAERGREGK